MTILIIGGDSRLSQYLEPALLNNKFHTIKTSRKNTKNSIHLNFSEIDKFIIPNHITHAIIVGGVTSYDDCENNYNYAYKINCINIPKLISKFLKKNIFIIYISTNTVFKYDSLPNETDHPNPGFPYAKLKFITENKINEIALNENKKNMLSILRLTKNVCENTSPFNDWIKNINNNIRFNVFRDLYFAPIKFYDSSNTIIKIIQQNAHGTFHLSGEKDISYSSFALEFLDYLNIDKNLCKEINSVDIGIKLRYNHNITSLSMKKTTNRLNINYIKLADIYKYLSKFINL